MSAERINLWILCLATALNRTAPPLVVLSGGLVGLTLAPSAAWATLPVALIVVGMGVFSYPAATLMQRIGRRWGFVLATIVAVLAAVAGAASIIGESFVGFSLAMVFIGANQSFVHQYRFAAAENVAADRASYAVSLILLSSLASAYAGPELGQEGRDWIADAPFAGAFLGLAAIQAVAACLLMFYREAPIVEQDSITPERPLRAIVSQPAYVLGVMAAGLSYAVMSLIMTAAPLSMHVGHGHSLELTAWAIQGHIVAMYLPSVFSGALVSRFGPYRNMIAGVVTMASCIGVASLGFAGWHYVLALILLGVGWNLLFTAGTTLVVTTYHGAERFKAQGVNDLIVFGTMAVMSLASGALLDFAGWHGLVMWMLPFLFFMLVLVVTMPRTGPMPQPA